MGEIKINIHKCEAPETGYWAEIPAMPGCITYADTLVDLKKNIIEAAQCWISMETEIALDAAKTDVVSGELQYA